MAAPPRAQPPAEASRPALHGLAPLAVTLLVCAGACATLFTGRWVVTGHHTYLFLCWNLFLAGLPFAFALMAIVVHEAAMPRLLRTSAVGFLLVLWLLFFPNAPYMVSDLTHLPLQTASAPRWFDSILFGAFIATGVTAGLASLLIVHGLVARRLGRLAGWAAVASASLLGGYGIVLGRFARLNSWDAWSRPRHLVGILLEPLRSPMGHPRAVVATALYAGFILLAYAAVVALLSAGRHLLPADPRLR